MAHCFCSVFNVVCRKRLSNPRCRSELIDSAWVVFVSGQKSIKKITLDLDQLDRIYVYRFIQSSSYSFPVTNVELEYMFNTLGFLWKFQK